MENRPGGYGYPGVELRIASGEPETDWSPYELFLYDVWPEVNASALDQAPDLYWYKLYNACGGNSVTQGGPSLALDRWNPVSVSLNPLDRCWPADGLDLSNITRMEFHTRDNETVNGNSGLWDDGDVLTLWFDNVRLVDQDNGAIRWQAVPGISTYYLYFDVLWQSRYLNSCSCRWIFWKRFCIYFINSNKIIHVLKIDCGLDDFRKICPSRLKYRLHIFHNLSTLFSSVFTYNFHCRWVKWYNTRTKNHFTVINFYCLRVGSNC